MKPRFITIGLCVLLCTTMLGSACTGPGCNTHTLSVGGSAVGALAGSATVSLGSGGSGNTSIAGNSTTTPASTTNTSTAGNVTDNETSQVVNNTTDSVSAVVENSTTTTSIASNSSSTKKTSADVAAFLKSDTTEDTPLNNINVPHLEYAENLCSHAKAAGFDVQAKTVSFQGGCPADRFVVVFQTSDKGQIIIDDTGIEGGNALDKVVTQLETGQMFKSSAFDGSCTKDYDRGNVASITDMPI